MVINYRCPLHDNVFAAVTCSRPPDTMKGHPDCIFCAQRAARDSERAQQANRRGVEYVPERILPHGIGPAKQLGQGD